MRKPKNSNLTLTALVVAVALCLGNGCTEDPTTGASCDTVRGDVAGVSLPVFNEASTLVGFHVEKASVSGSMTGTASADFTITRIGEDGTLHLTGSHTFWDEADRLLFETEDEGLTTSAGVVENHMTLVNGASGELKTEGTVNLETGALSLRYEGEVCR